MIAKGKAYLAIGLILALFFSAGILLGRENASITQGKGGMGYFMGGVGMLSESGRNAVIYSAGGGGHSIKNRLVIGGEGHSAFGPDNAGGYGFFDIGYAVFSTHDIVLYPLVGIGGGAMTRDADSSVSTCALLNPAIGFDYLIYRKDRSGMLLGLRAGYTFTVYSDTWSWSMLYIRLVIGGFGFE
jgi:hypothetical protein